MRLARLAALGLAIGVIAGFAIALLRPRSRSSSTGLAGPFADRAGSTRSDSDDQLWDQFRKAEESPVVELRTHRRVTG